MSDSSAEDWVGFVLLGVFISLWLCGVLSFQTLYFYTHYPHERKWLKVFVGILYAADGAQTLVGMGIIWNLVIIHTHEPDTPNVFARMFQIYPVFVGLISGSVQVFFAWRIKVLSTNFTLFVIIAALALPQFVGGIAYTVLTVKAGRFPHSSHFIGVIIGWVAPSVLCDLVITATLTVTLRRHRENRELGEAAHLIHRIKIMSIHNSLVTILWSLALLVAMVSSKRGAYCMFLYPLGKVYLITMLASLNSRPVVRHDMDPRINSVLQRSVTPRLPSLILSSPREFMDDVEKIGRPSSTHSRTGSRSIGYLPVTQEECEEIPRSHSTSGRPSNECTEIQPLVSAPFHQKNPSPPRSTKSVSRPRGPRLPTAPCSAAYRSVSAL